MYEEFFVERLSSLRNQKNVSAREMSLALGQNAGYISNIENRKSFPSMNGFFYICEYFEITPQEFFDEGNIAPTEMRELFQYARSLNRSKLESLVTIAKALTK